MAKKTPRKWLCKSEPDVYSIDDLKKDKVTPWDNIRNYQARNFLKEMEVGDLVLFYHSNAKPPGIAGIAKVAKTAYPDESQFDKKSPYFDPKATKDEPRWFNPDMRFVKAFKNLLSLDELRAEKELEDMLVLKRGSRLSVQPVSDAEFEHILKIAK